MECCWSSSPRLASWARPSGTSRFEKADGGIGRSSIYLSFRGLDDLIHADTMLFILGLTLFVSVIAQTRLLEGITFALLRRNQGAILPTVISVTAFVAVASAVFGGVSMIGLTIRTLVIILLLAAAPTSAIRYAVIVCTAITTICGVWVAYGEPPNLIMKANLYPLLGNAFFVIYCAPAAIVSYLLIARQLRKRLRNQHVYLDTLDVIEANAAGRAFPSGHAARRGADSDRVCRGSCRRTRRPCRGRSEMAASRRIVGPFALSRKCPGSDS